MGVEKPDPGMFLAAGLEAGCEVAELMHVGDSLEKDVAGANAVGAVSVWLNRDGRPNDTGVEPDHEIRTLAEMEEILGGYRVVGR